MSSKIHPSAIVPPSAVVGDGCEIGPYCVLGPEVRLGQGCVLHSHVVVDGCTTIGDEVEIFSGAVVGKKTQDLKYKGGTPCVRVGNRTVVREYVTVHCATNDGDATVVGSDCLIQAYCHIAHDCVVGDHIIMSSGAKIAGHVQVGDYAVIGGMSGVVQFVRVGTMAFVGGYSKLAQDALPYCITDGIPAATVAVNRIGMERNNRSAEAVRGVGEALKLIMRSGLSLAEAVTLLASKHACCPEVLEIVEFVRTCERGLARPKNRGA
jgi:UDP-N-acetylglucosamine acyltransferase